jgi:hypothetical protein
VWNGDHVQNERPYPSNSDSVQDHIVVVSEYSGNTIYINDPLAFTANGNHFAVPSNLFEQAAARVGWVAMALVP